MPNGARGASPRARLKPSTDRAPVPPSSAPTPPHGAAPAAGKPPRGAAPRPLLRASMGPGVRPVADAPPAKPRASTKRVSFGGEKINFFHNESSSPEEAPPASKKAPRTDARRSPGSRPSRSRAGSAAFDGPIMFPSPLPPNRKRFEDFSDEDDDGNDGGPESEQQPVPPQRQSSQPAKAISPRRASNGVRGRSYSLFTDEQVAKGREDPKLGEQEGDITVQLNPRASRRRESTMSVGSDSDVTRNIPNITGLVGEDEMGSDPMDISPAAPTITDAREETSRVSDAFEPTLQLANLLEEDEGQAPPPPPEILPDVRASRVSLAPVAKMQSTQSGADEDDASKEALPDIRASRVSLAPMPQLNRTRHETREVTDDAQLVPSARGHRVSLAPILPPASENQEGEQELENAIPDSRGSRLSLAPIVEADHDNDLEVLGTGPAPRFSLPDLDESPGDSPLEDDSCITLKPFAMQGVTENDGAQRSPGSSNFGPDLAGIISQSEEVDELPSVPIPDVEPSHVRKLFDTKPDGEDDTLHFQTDVLSEKSSSKAKAATEDVGENPTPADAQVDTQVDPHVDAQVEVPVENDTNQSESALPAVASSPIKRIEPEQVATQIEPVEQTEPQAADIAASELSLAPISNRSPAPAPLERTPMGANQVVQSTPRSETGKKIQAMYEERSSARRMRSTTGPVEVQSSKPLPRAQKAPADVSSEASTGTFNLTDFQNACKSCNFNFTAPPDLGREASVAPLAITSKLDRFSTAGLVYEITQQNSLLQRLEHEIANIENQQRETIEDVRQMELELERTCPEEFMKVCNLKGQSTVSRFSIHLKRLYKISSMQVKHLWVSARQEWEQDISDSVEAQVQDLESDVKCLRESEENLLRMSDSIAIGDSTSPVGNEEESIVLRRSVVQELSFVRDLKNFIATMDADEHDLNDQQATFLSKRTRLGASCKKLESYAGADTFEKLGKLAREKQETNTILSGLIGLRPTQLKKNNIVLRAADMVDMNFSVHEDRVINVSCKAVAFPGCSEHWSSYLDGVVKMVGSSARLRDVRFMCDIPYALFCSRGIVMSTKAVFEDVARYLSENIGTLVTASLDASGEPSVEVRIEASFFSTRLRSKFDVTVSLKTFTSPLRHGSAEQLIEVISVNRFFGTLPSDASIRETIERSRRTNTGSLKMSEGLKNLWAVLA